MEALLPIEPSADTVGIPGNQFLWEPSASTVLEQLLPRYVATRIFQAVLETTASEQSSRMVAMRNATDNAQELIEDLTLTYNKVRQANITREMIEIATGASISRCIRSTVACPSACVTSARSPSGRISDEAWQTSMDGATRWRASWGCARGRTPWR